MDVNFWLTNKEFVGGIIGILFGIIEIIRRQVHIKNNIEKIEISINGRLESLLRLTASQGRLEGAALARTETAQANMALLSATQVSPVVAVPVATVPAQEGDK